MINKAKIAGTILVIEDDEADVLLLRRSIAAWAGAITVEVSPSMQAAEQWLTLHRCDLVLLDQSLPDCHGLDGIARVRQQSVDVPIVMLTGLDDETMATQARQQGAADYLVKGASSPQVFAERIQRVIEEAQSMTSTTR